MIKRITILLIAIFFAVCLFSQSENISDHNFKVNYYTIENGLSNNKVNAICKDRFGFMWFGTNEGLNRYNGYNIKAYKYDKDDTTSISNNLIRSIIKDSDGVLWVATDDGINYYDSNIDAFVRVAIDETSYDLNFVWQLFEDKNGVLWIATHHGLYYKEKGSLKVVAFNEINSMVDNPHVVSVFLDTRNILWVGTREHGLLTYNFNTKKRKQYISDSKNGNSISENWITVIYETKGGDLFIGTLKNGLNLYSYENDSFSQIILDNSVLNENIKTIVEDKYKRLWVGTSLGLFLKKDENYNFIRFAHSNNDYTILNNNSVFYIFIDEFDILWLGTYAGGVNYIDLNQKRFNHYSFGNNQYSLNSNTVYTICEDSKNNLMIGTVNGGINYFNSSTKTFEYFLDDDQKTNSLSGNNVKAIIEDRIGNFWIGTYKNGLNYFNIQENTFTHYRAQKLNQLSLANDNIYDLLLDSEDNLWIATEGSLDLMPKERNEILHLGSKGFEKNIFEGGVTSCVFEDSNNDIWVGTYNHGLLLFNKADTSFTIIKEDIFNSFVYSISEDNENKLWISTANGLYSMNLQTHNVIHYTERDGLPASTVYKSFNDNNGNIWVSTTAGLSKFINGVSSPEIPIFRNYTTDDGLQSNQFVYNSNDKSRSGKMYFGGINGFNSFYPDEIKDNPYKANVVIEGLKIFNKEVAIGEELKGQIVLKKPIHDTKELILSYKLKIFTLSFAALHYAQPSKIQYAYRLEGFDDRNADWNYTNSNNRNATYSNLDGGEYIFKVKATNNDGLWNETPTILKIKILPPFWKKWWFILLCIAIIVLTVSIFYYVRINGLKRQKMLLEKTVQARTNELLSANNELVLTNELLEEHTQTIEEQSEELMAQKDELIKANNNLEELNKTKDKFMSIIAHDIKSPFQSVMGLSDILYNNVKSLSEDELSTFSKAINDSSVSIYNLLENLLEWSRAQTKNIKYHPTNFKLKDLFENNKTLLHENLHRKNIELVFDGINDNEVYADRDMIDAVIRNLISNAIKFTSINGKIFISFKKSDVAFVISVKDNGVGMSDNDVKNLFILGQNISKDGTIGEKGTGLGLLICKEFIEMHSGKIWVESALGKGSTFFFTIPTKV